MNVRLHAQVGLLLLTAVTPAVALAGQTEVPPVPNGVIATPGNAEVGLRWSPESSATSYHLKRSTASGGPYKQIAAPAFAGYTDVSRTNGVTYFYVVSAANAAGESRNSAQVSATPKVSVANLLPAAPAGLNVAPGNGQVSVTWSATTSATSYHLKRSASISGPYTQIASPSWHGYTDVGVTNHTTYFYVVSAVGPFGEGPNSSAISAMPSAPPPIVTFVIISPAIASSIEAGTLPFTAMVGGTASNKTVTWKASLGEITSSGQYTAPSTAGTDTITATSNADPTKSASISVKVSAAAVPPPPPNPPAPPPAPPPSTQPTPPSSPLPVTFFGQTVSWIQASHFPTVPFGGLRLWDTNTTWAQIETNPGTYTWIDLDAWLRSASSHGKDVMYTFGRVPHWASMRPSEACPYSVTTGGCAAPPSDVDSGDSLWKTFVTALVQHSLSSPDLHISYYELWNEPDISKTWTGTPAQLATMSKDAYAIIHSLDSTAKVVGPSASTANQYGVHFLPEFYAAGGAPPEDIVSLHAYLYTGSDFSTTPTGIITSIAQLQKLMATYQISDKPIWFTEGNWNADGLGSLTDAQKAAYLAQEYMLMWSTGAVARYYWYAWDSKAGTLWTPTTGLTPAGTAFNLLTDWLVGSTHLPNPCSVGSDGTWTCALTLATGYEAEIIWNPETSTTITVDPAFITYQTLTSSALQPIANHQVAVGTLPILIVGNQASESD